MVAQQMIHDLCDERESSKVRIHRNTFAEYALHPPLVALLDDGAVDELQLVPACDGQPVITKGEPLFNWDAFEAAGALPQITGVDFEVLRPGQWEVLGKGGIEFLLDHLPDRLRDDDGTEDKDWLLRILQVVPRVS